MYKLNGEQKYNELLFLTGDKNKNWISYILINNSMEREHPLNQSNMKKNLLHLITLICNFKMEHRRHVPNNPGSTSNKSNNGFWTIAIFRQIQVKPAKENKLFIKIATIKRIYKCTETIVIKHTYFAVFLHKLCFCVSDWRRNSNIQL